LDILKEEDVRATFFLNSYDKDNPYRADTSQNYLLRYADVLRRMVDDGHAIGNHTYSHQDLAQLSIGQMSFQLDTLQRQLSEVLGDKTPRLYLIRPPFGSPWLGNWNTKKERKKVCSELKDRGIVMLWTTGWDSSDSADWAMGEWYEASAKRYHPGSAPYERKMEREEGRILRRADGSAGGVILMHDTHPTSRDVLKPLIDELKRRGYSFGTLEDYCRWRWGQSVFDRFNPGFELPQATADPQPKSPPAPLD
jgi:peptidoglycan/xylan/chitin deacetylase (PgdA/CDA1 family)